MREVLPTRNQLRYKYNKDDDLIQLEAVNAAGNVLGTIKVDQKPDRKFASWDGKESKVEYFFDKKNENIVKTSPSHALSVSYEYDSHDRLSKKILPNGRFQQVKYYTEHGKKHPNRVQQ